MFCIESTEFYYFNIIFNIIDSTQNKITISVISRIKIKFQYKITNNHSFPTAIKTLALQY